LERYPLERELGRVPIWVEVPPNIRRGLSETEATSQ
jgi:hypothetical protein